MMSFWASDDDVVNNNYYNSVDSDIDDDDDDDDDDGYIDSSNIEEQIVCLKAEYAFQMSKNSQLQRELEKINVRIRRRQKIVEFYDDYIFNYVFDEDDNKFDMKELCDSIDIIDIDKDYKSVIRTIQYEETQRLEAEEEEEWNMYELSSSSTSNTSKARKHQSSATMAIGIGRIYSSNSKRRINGDIMRINGIYGGRMRSKSAAHVMHSNILYQVSPDDILIEKNWMKELRKKQFKIFVNKYRKQRLIKLKKESEQKLKELEQQINIKQRIEQLNNLKNKVEALKKSKIIFIETASKEIEQLRNVINKLNLSQITH